MSEIFPLRARGVASGVCVVTNWGCAFLVTKIFHDLLVSCVGRARWAGPYPAAEMSLFARQDLLTPYGTFWLFAAFCGLNVLFTVLCVPETKGKTLEQIESYFQQSPQRGRFFSSSIQ